MNNKLFFILLLFHLSVGIALAQVPIVGTPVKLDLGVSGGVSIPDGTSSNTNSTGWHAGAKVRLHGFMPLNVVVSGHYNRPTDKFNGISDHQWMIGGGLEYPFPSVVVKPYFGVEALLNLYNNTESISSSYTHGGVALGAGVEFSIPMFGSFDTSLKYQVFNIIGKEDSEKSISQIAASVALMFAVL